MRLLSIFTTIIAVLITVLITFLTIYNLIFGNVNILLPGLGLIISSWLIIFGLAIIDVIVIFLALYLWRSSNNFR
jgi:hypothetical protein